MTASLAILLFAQLFQWFSLTENYEKAAVFEKFAVKGTEFYFVKACAAYRANDFAKARSYLRNVLTPLPGTCVSERHKAVAELLMAEMAYMEQQPLGGTANKMSNVTRRLRLGYGGPQTQKLQKEIIKDLDDMIAKAEQQLQQQQANAQSSGDAQRSQRPAENSDIIGGEAGKGVVDKRKFGKGPETWGKMPPKEKLKALETLDRSLPPHMREAGEGYRNNLIKGMPK